MSGDRNKWAPVERTADDISQDNKSLMEQWWCCLFLFLNSSQTLHSQVDFSSHSSSKGHQISSLTVNIRTTWQTNWNTPSSSSLLPHLDGPLISSGAGWRRQFSFFFLHSTQKSAKTTTEACVKRRLPSRTETGRTRDPGEVSHTHCMWNEKNKMLKSLTF